SLASQNQGAPSKTRFCVLGGKPQTSINFPSAGAQRSGAPPKTRLPCFGWESTNLETTDHTPSTIKSMPRFPPGQTLLIDGDDTLWENNVYFERAIAAFISYLDHHEYSPAQVRQQLNAVERETILAHGYGLPSFTRSLVRCFERLSPHPLDE